MQGSEMRDIRKRLGLDQLQFAREIGFTGTDRNDVTRIRKYENGKQQIPLYLARFVWLLDARYEGPIPVKWPQWPGYEFDHTPDEEKFDPVLDSTSYVYQGGSR